MTAPPPEARASPPRGERRPVTLRFHPVRCGWCVSGGCGRRWRMEYPYRESVPCGGAKIKTSVAFSALAPADVARLTPPNALPITRLDPRIRPDARFGGVSRAAKGADCKSAGLAFVGSSPTSPTSQVLSHQRPVIRKSGRLMADG